MTENASYIHFEGMDLAGKTTATQNFIMSTGTEWDMRHNSLSKENPMLLEKKTLTMPRCLAIFISPL
jgi:hypothetical protein